MLSILKKLFYGDNLDVLKNFQYDSVDLIYLDPPFNSKLDYNIIFKNSDSKHTDSQIQAFEDTWSWGMQSESEYDQLFSNENTEFTEIISSLRNFLGENDLMAYLVMISSRLIQLHRVLKSTGSLYFHCDNTASHYIKIILDGIFGPTNFRSEIIWKRTFAHSDSKSFGNNTDRIFLYTKSSDYIFNPVLVPYEQKYIERFNREDPDGRKWQDDSLSAKGLSGGGYEYEYKGISAYWRCPIETMERLDKENRLHFTKNGGIRLKSYLDEKKGRFCQSLWEDIPPLNSQSKERLGYPTQKPLSLLERIIKASSKENDVILDPFCGCGTAIHAAEKLHRNWIGIDITHLAISLIEKRLKDAFNLSCEVEGTPKDFSGAKDLAFRDKYQFQWWACSLVNAIPYKNKKKGADGGIDGLIFFNDTNGKKQKIIVSVKGGKNISVAMIRELIQVVNREKGSIGIFVTLFKPTEPMIKEGIKEGFYKLDKLDNKYPKIQIITIEELLNKTNSPKYPFKTFGNIGFNKASREENELINQGKFNL